AIIGLM
nr:Chain A, Amyloid Beta A4 Protein [Homo sapiens]2Y3J_B Chain B, Amyloid Beta A4 Protein [Homo sapiens]2Y3J_C Chain C, Amyloid Beta A4 Protein [Homo sapiens]2Y3J_D Chain D, Amyloid Beta A4 Protein [Homo sapiens]2Y3J_E Chain E, Amyloid Beta A4 Protein [Homo sapiens]2Y3J_F Chain F, Amyloid Beta A4 Protein [Homo sapiens]2Y3J_G Chain G, Amyloid Beta A4 Protein [Homo sapiens]2Y3J_H Chain H, Amyloid Beta A4 Protein [Homo sapiens]